VDTLIFLVGILAGLLQVTGYVLYYVPLYKGTTRPNISGWALWSFGTLVGLLSYKGMTHDWAKIILPILCNLSCLFIFIYALRKGNYKPFDEREKRVGKIYFLAAVAALFTPTYGNLIQQFGTLVSFWPYIKSVRNGTAIEKPLPWFVWAAAYSTLLVVCLLKFNGWQELVYPINCLVLHGTIGILALQKSHKA
jgi:hypothetical protein